MLVLGGTGTLGQALVRRMLGGANGAPRAIRVLSRDEAKQHDMREALGAADLDFRIGDVRDASAVLGALKGIDLVFAAAALKQVPFCEYQPFEAVLSNVVGPQNLVCAVRDHALSVETVVGISTDKACKPVSVMGMTKALQERIFVDANRHCDGTRFVAVRYGNVIASRGSVVPLFRRQLAQGRALTVTSLEMTRFLLTLDQAVDTVVDAAYTAKRGEIYVPRVPSARVVDVARAVAGDANARIEVTGVRPGEKLHEILLSEEELPFVARRGDYYALTPQLPELQDPAGAPGAPRLAALDREYTSATDLLTLDAIRALLAAAGA